MKSISFTCDHCGAVTSNVRKNDGFPLAWTTVKFEVFANHAIGARPVHFGTKRELHYCSKRCFVNSMFLTDDEEKACQDELKRRLGKKS